MVKEVRSLKDTVGILFTVIHTLDEAAGTKARMNSSHHIWHL